MIKLFQINRKYSFITTLKKLGKKNYNYLSFPDNGYTITFDIKYSDDVKFFYKELEKELLVMNAKIYLTKDSLMSSKHFKKTYNKFNKFKKIKKLIDKNNFFQSFQSKRLLISE